MSHETTNEVEDLDADGQSSSDEDAEPTIEEDEPELEEPSNMWQIGVLSRTLEKFVGTHYGPKQHPTAPKRPIGWFSLLVPTKHQSVCSTVRDARRGPVSEWPTLETSFQSGHQISHRTRNHQGIDRRYSCKSMVVIWSKIYCNLKYILLEPLASTGYPK